MNDSTKGSTFENLVTYEDYKQLCDKFNATPRSEDNTEWRDHYEGLYSFDKIDKCKSESYTIPGLSPETPIEENENGAKQSKSPYAFEQISPKAIFALAKTLKRGEETYGKDNWKGISCESHLNHALQHIYGFLAGDTQDEHLAHAFTRLMMAIDRKEVD